MRAAGLWLFLLFQGLFGLVAAGWPWRVQDEAMVYFQAESLWERGSLALPQVHPERLFGMLGRDGTSRWAPYGPGVAFAALPHHGLGRALAAAAGVPREPRGVDARGGVGPWTVVVGGVTALAGSTWAALAVVGLWAAARAAGAPARRALWVAGLLGAGSYLLSYAGSLYSEPLAAALAAWCAWALLRARPGLAALLLGALGLVKGTNLFLTPALMTLAWLDPDRPRGRRAAALLFGAAVLTLAAHAGWNERRFGSMAEAGYTQEWLRMLAPGGAPVPFELATLPRGLFGLLLAPGKSLLLFAPPLLLLVPGARARLRGAPRLCACAGVALLTGLVVWGSYFYWEGGYCHGPRHLLPALPLLLLPLARGPLPARPARVALVAGAAVGLMGALVSFVEDQALGPDKEHQDYYRILPPEEVGPGRPLNVYRLGYQPWTRYPGRITAHLSQAEQPPGEGLEAARAHLVRLRAAQLRTGVAPIPGWVPWAVWLPFPLLLAAGVLGVRHASRAATGARG
mgnify:CR=1 FL=1